MSTRPLPARPRGGGEDDARPRGDDGHRDGRFNLAAPLREVQPEMEEQRDVAAVRDALVSLRRQANDLRLGPQTLSALDQSLARFR